MNFHLAKYFLNHLITSKNEHSIHSPFVFEFYNECLKSKSQYYCFDSIEIERKKLLKESKPITVTDFGAGSLVVQNKKRNVKEIAKNSLKSPFLAQQLFRIVNYLKPKSIIELGTSLGITTSYLALPNSKSSLQTFEGCPEISKIALQTFNNLYINNINLIQGNINDTLKIQLSKINNIDFVYFDGNHKYEPTLTYFNLCKEKANENTCFIFDDIYWSLEMKKAWKEIQNHPDVMISIDTFYFGICFFRNNQPKQHFILR